MDLQKEREAFENHLKKMGKTDNETFSKNEDDSYQMDIIHFGWKIWQAAKAQAVPEGFVVVPVQCPDPDFADMLFDELSKNAIGEFGDDLLIHFSDIDEEKIWGLMLEAAQEPAND